MSERGKLVGQVDSASLRQELLRIETVTVTTNTISGNSTEFFEISEDESIVTSVDFEPENADLPPFGRLISIRVNISSGSTDSSVRVYESENGEDINQVTEIENLDTNSSPESFIFAGSLGLPFVNRQDEESLFLEVEELSGNSSDFEIKLVYTSINTEELTGAGL